MPNPALRINGAQPGVSKHLKVLRGQRAAEGEPYVFSTAHEGQLQPHYGRFLTLQRDRLVELTWMSRALGTAGAETVVTVEPEPNAAGTRLRLTHAGFYDQEGVERHDQAWEQHVLPHLDVTLAAR